jgi:hypothetical protein
VHVAAHVCVAILSLFYGDERNLFASDNEQRDFTGTKSAFKTTHLSSCNTAFDILWDGTKNRFISNNVGMLVIAMRTHLMC